MERAFVSLLLAMVLVLAGPALASGDPPSAAQPEAEHGHHDHAAMSGASGTGDDPHAQHRMMMQQPSVQVQHQSYSVPPLTLQDSDGKDVDLAALLASDRPIAVNFIFTTCTTICPVMTATMLQLQKTVAGRLKDPLFVSLSIDPDHDTAAIMQKYAQRFGAEWTFLTGKHDTVMAALKTFDAWRGNKMNHEALTLLRQPGQSDWTRVVGLASADQLAAIWSDGAT